MLAVNSSKYITELRHADKTWQATCCQGASRRESTAGKRHSAGQPLAGTLESISKNRVVWQNASGPAQAFEPIQSEQVHFSTPLSRKSGNGYWVVVGG
jgi:hypothetical protein